MSRDEIVIANCGGFWGDDPTAARRQLEGGPIDYLCMDYLAELAMSILRVQRRRKPEAGFASDIVAHLRDVLPLCVERGVRVICNAGGVNPFGCRDQLNELAAELGLSDVRIGVVTGDDVFDRLQELVDAGEPLASMDTGSPLSDVLDRVVSANAYLGARPVARALDLGADVVICGRVTDAGLTLAPMIHEFGWASDDWDRLAAGVVAGHIVECGTQCTGGNFTDWKTVEDWTNLGFPLVEARADGTFTITKHPRTGGLCTVHSVTEQLLYELREPRYASPDCVARFDTVRMESDGPDRVAVSGVRGEPAPEDLKLAVGYANGYRAFGRLIVTGPDALAKAEKLSEIVWACAGGRDLYDDTATHFVAYDGTHPPLSGHDPSEILVQFGARDADRDKIDHRFAAQVIPRVLGSVPGILYPTDQGRPRAARVISFWPALLPAEHVPASVTVGEEEITVAPPEGRAPVAPCAPSEAPTAGPDGVAADGDTVRVALMELCLARAGDKGNMANIGVIARSPAVYAWMRDHLASAFVAERFAATGIGRVERHELENVLAMNFLLFDSLGGGGTVSLMVDSQAKTYAQYLLAAEVTVPAALLEGLTPPAPSVAQAAV